MIYLDIMSYYRIKVGPFISVERALDKDSNDCKLKIVFALIYLDFLLNGHIYAHPVGLVGIEFN